MSFPPTLQSISHIIELWLKMILRGALLVVLQIITFSNVLCKYRMPFSDENGVVMGILCLQYNSI